MPVVKTDSLQIEKLTLGAYETNAYILVCMKTRESLVVDAPADSGAIIEALKGTLPKYILLTHDHYDHTGVIVSLRARSKAPLATHELNTYQLKTQPEILLKDGDTVTLGQLKIEAIHTPGHTPGSLCFKADKYLFGGDTLFPGGPGHTDTPDDFKRILDSITGRLFRLPADTIILPGHGDSTTIGESKKEYAIFAAKPHESLYGDVNWLNS